MEDKKVLKDKELEKVTGGTDKDLEKQINDALNEVIVSNPTIEKYKNRIKINGE